MSSFGSSIAPAREQLHAGLADHPPFAEPHPDDAQREHVQVTYGLPGDDERWEIVAMLGVQGVSEDDAVVGNQRRNETYEIPLVVKVYDPAASDADRPTVDARGFEIADEIRDVVSKDPTLGGAVRFARVSSQTSDGVGLAQGGGLVIYLQVNVRCEARIPAGRAP